jgi:ketosteroid isomerase-like protein
MKQVISFIFLAVTASLGALAGQFEDTPRATPTETSQRDAVQAVLVKQQTAWNQGDVVAFMDGYWNSPELTFLGATGVTRGYAATLARYQKSYPDQASRGHLDFTELEVHSLAKDAALVVGRWHLKRQSGDLGGVFSTVFQRFPEGWKIVSDHTSIVAPEKQ